VSREREVPVRIVYRRKKTHAAHHGGAWKVALADFMTAMFALFLVLWLVNQSSDVKAAVAGYFADPLGRAKEFGSSIMPGQGAPQERMPRVVDPSSVVDMRRQQLGQLAQQLKQRLAAIPELQSLASKVDIQLTAEGLRIQLLEDPKGVFFQTGSADLSQNGREMLQMIGGELARLPNEMRIEGHTDARPYSGNSTYTNWELSADRANAARRILTQNCVPDARILQIRGLADRQLRVPEDPLSASNRRISILVMFDDRVAGDGTATTTGVADSTAAGAALPLTTGAAGDSAAALPVTIEPVREGTP